MTKKIKFIIFIAVFYLSPFVFSQQAEETIAIPSAQMASLKEANESSQLMWRYYLGLAIVGSIALAGFILVKKTRQLVPRKVAPYKMKVINHLSLGPKKNLTIIEVAGEHILLGVTDHQVSLIKSLSILEDDFNESSLKSFEQVSQSIDEKNSEDKFKDFTEEEFSISAVKSIVQKKMKDLRA